MMIEKIKMNLPAAQLLYVVFDFPCSHHSSFCVWDKSIALFSEKIILIKMCLDFGPDNQKDRRK